VKAVTAFEKNIKRLNIMKTKLLLTAALIGAVSLSAHAGIRFGFSVGLPLPPVPVVVVAPPAPVVVATPPCPGTGYAWVPGYWSGRVWTAGFWRAPVHVYAHPYYYGHPYGGHRW
jgi:hypothetical protein